MREIIFTRNWNNKLNCDKWTTIRMSTPERLSKYEEGIDKEFKIVGLEEGVKQTAILRRIEQKILWEIQDSLFWYDAGMDREEFEELMDGFYREKEAWIGLRTPMLILFFENVRTK